MEKEALTIPKDVFHSKFRWSFFQARKDPIFCLFLITCVVIKFSRFEGSVSVLVILVGSYLAGARRALKKNIEKLCNEVIDQRPGADTLKWNLITQRLNGLLYDEGLYNNPYCIFDGEHCQELFRELVLEPSLQKSDKLYLETANFAKASRLYQEDLLRQWKDFADNGKLEDSEERESYEKLAFLAYTLQRSFLEYVPFFELYTATSVLSLSTGCDSSETQRYQKLTGAHCCLPFCCPFLPQNKDRRNENRGEANIPQDSIFGQASRSSRRLERRGEAYE